jgi:hypothetical protein
MIDIGPDQSKASHRERGREGLGEHLRNSSKADSKNDDCWVTTDT